MSVPVAADGAAVNVYGHSAAANYVDLRAERHVLAVLSNCPQMHNPCNAYNLTPIRARSSGDLRGAASRSKPGARRAIVSAPIYHLIPNAPKPVAPYSHVVEADGWLFVTGQLATDPDDDSLPLPEGIEAQTRKVMDNLKRALAGAGAGFEDVVCARIFLTHFERDYAAFNRLYTEYFKPDRLPARTTVGVTHLARGGIVEIDLIARRS